MANNNQFDHRSNVSIERVKVSNKKLQTNPFTTYRDPQTGRWVVVKPAAA